MPKVPHLTCYHEPGYGDKPYCVDMENPDNEDGTRCPGDDGRRFATPEQAGKFVAAWLKGRTREQDLFQEALKGLTEFYPQLKRKSVVESVRKQVKVPDTGNAQADYDNVRNQIEVLLNKQNS
jgi:hypothetical protein